MNTRVKAKSEPKPAIFQGNFGLPELYADYELNNIEKKHKGYLDKWNAKKYPWIAFPKTSNIIHKNRLLRKDIN